MLSGVVFNIQRYSIHDGPGIRTTIFFKGCPLNCWWCHNPESQSIKKQIMYFENRCILCGECTRVCPEKAILINKESISYDREKCRLCGKCIDKCLQNARELSGNIYTVDELFNEIEKDFIFYEQSKGGVTFSGGEPLCQIDFLEGILKKCVDNGIHTTLDTSLYSPWTTIDRILNYTDLFLVDIKHMDSITHKKYTGVENHLILENIKKLSMEGKKIYIRFPVIPGINDEIKNLESMRDFIKDLNITQINLLPYHKMGMDKYKRILTEYKLEDLKEPSNDHMNDIADFISQAGVKVKIGG